MKLSPRYHRDPLIVLPPRDLAAVVATQRRRLADMLGEFDDAQWAHPSRCAGWNSQDVINHLVEANQFWTYSVRCAVDGAPSTLLTDFDPVSNPARSVAKVRDLPPGETLARFLDTNEQLTLAMAQVSDWTLPAEAPPGHLTMSTALHHALWDCWTHERDIALPLGLDPVVDADEVATCLRYVLALGPAFALTLDESRRGRYAVATTDPQLSLEVIVDGQVTVHEGANLTATLSGPALVLLEMLSMRAPFTIDVPDADRWLFTGLATVFDEAPAPSR